MPFNSTPINLAADVLNFQVLTNELEPSLGFNPFEIITGFKHSLRRRLMRVDREVTLLGRLTVTALYNQVSVRVDSTKLEYERNTHSFGSDFKTSCTSAPTKCFFFAMNSFIIERTIC